MSNIESINAALVHYGFTRAERITTTEQNGHYANEGIITKRSVKRLR